MAEQNTAPSVEETHTVQAEEIPQLEAEEPIQPEVVEVPLDPEFFDATFTAQTAKVRMLETEAYRKKCGQMKAEEQLVVTVRALTSDQFFKAKAEGEKADDWKKIRDVFIEKSQATVPPELKKAIAKAEESVGKETVFRIELILRGAKNDQGLPLLKRSQVVNLAEFFTQDFMSLSNAVLDLQGEGPHAGE